MKSKQIHLDRLGSSLHMLLTIVLVGVICGFAPPVINRAEASAETSTATDEISLPVGVSSDWWSAVQEDIRLSEYDVTWQEQTPRMVSVDLPAAYQAPNRAQNLRTYFTEQGIWVIPRVFEGEVPPWEWGLALTGYGYEYGMQPVGAANLSSHDNRIEYRRSDPLTGTGQVLTEWYVNDERGLEQGFILHAPPQSIIENSQSRIVLDLALHGNLTAALDHAGQTIEFTTSDGVRVLRYADLTVFDGAARQLPAHFSLLPNGAEGDMGGIRITFDATAARYPITVDPLATSPAWTAESNQDSAYFGASVGTAGDVNGDGYSDVIIGAPLYDNGQTNEGRAYVYHGSAGGLAITPAWTAESNQADARFGWSVGTAGDVHDDGYSDVIIGAYLYDSGATDTGSAYLYRGSAVGLVASSSWTAGSGQANAQFGYSVSAAGDVNGDGYSDVIVGAPEYNGNGRVYVYHGMAAGLTGPVMAFDFSGSFGHSVGTAGDVNGDGYSDVIVGAPYYDIDQTDEGLAAVLRGSPGGVIPAIMWVVNGNQNGANLGYSVAAAGDVNGDGYSDVIVGVPYYDNGQEDEGLANIHNGSAAGLATTANWTAESNQTGAAFGHSVATAGDMNGDSYSDVIVGAPLYDDHYADVGLVVGYHGGASGMAATVAWTAEVNEPNANCGWSVGTAGDINGDGYSDVIVGAPYFDNGQTDEGLALVYHGSAAGLAATVGWTAESNWAEAAFGISVGTAGDVNGDGYSDIVVGANYFDNGQSDEGAAFLYHGSAVGLATTYAWTAESNQDYAYFGYSVSTAGDVNGDGYSDVVIGAYLYDNSQNNEGRAFVYYGNNGDGLDLVPQQRRADGSVPLAPGGQSISPTQVHLAASGRSPYGRGDVRLQWEVKPQGTSFNGSGLGQGTWQDSGTVGYALNELVSGLTFETRYHWRVRLQYHPATTPYQPYSRWLYGGPFFTALSGDQAIAGTGLTNLLGQTASVNVTDLGSPSLTTLTLRGYPNTAPPDASSFPGYGSGTSILDRYFSIVTNSGASGYTLTLCLNYEDSEVAAAGATEAGLRLCSWTGSTWACPERSASSNVNINLVCADGVTEFSNWAMASSPPTCSEWDVNCDGQVNVVDVQLVAGAWNNPPTYQAAYDHDHNGVVDIIDVEFQVVHWASGGQAS